MAHCCVACWGWMAATGIHLHGPFYRAQRTHVYRPLVSCSSNLSSYPLSSGAARGARMRARTGRAGGKTVASVVSVSSVPMESRQISVLLFRHVMLWNLLPSAYCKKAMKCAAVGSMPLLLPACLGSIHALATCSILVFVATFPVLPSVKNKTA